MLSLYNTLTRTKEPFKPADGETALMYNCGPTVYHYAHLGNLRAFVFADILRRTIENEGFAVKQVMNITDVGHLVSDEDEGEDKLEKGARRDGKSVEEVAKFYTNAFFQDIEALNIKKADHYPRATDHIEEQIALIQILEKKGYTYRTSDGIYFDISKYPDYGKLARLNLEGQESTDRVENNPEKRNTSDFALWIFNEFKKQQQEWDSPWGAGFPGWHVECSAMAMKYLGETLDIHTGGIDHIPVHHTNERAQSVCSTDNPFSRFWMHGEFVNVESGKMAKSEDNFLRLETLTQTGIDPLSYRYWLLSAHYRTMMEFNQDAISGAQKALVRLYEFFENLPNEDGSKPDEGFLERFHQAIGDDLGTPKALAILWDLVKNDEINPSVKKATLLQFDEVLGLDLLNAEDHLVVNIPLEDLPQNFQTMVVRREKARADKDFEKADQIRDEMTALGYEIKDSASGPEVKKSGK